MQRVVQLTKINGIMLNDYVDLLKTTQQQEIYLKANFNEICSLILNNSSFDLIIEMDNYNFFARLKIEFRQQVFEVKSQAKDLSECIRDIYRKSSQTVAKNYQDLTRRRSTVEI